MTTNEHLPPLLPSDEFSEPFSGVKYDRAYGAMPANPFRDEHVKERQARVSAELTKLFEYPPQVLEVPDSFRDVLLEDHFIGEQRRNMQNYDCYGLWRQRVGAIPADIVDQVDRFETGHAEPGDVLDVAVAAAADETLPDLISFEVGKVTCPYWQRIEHVAPFRAATAESLESRGGILYPTIQPYRSIDVKPFVAESPVPPEPSYIPELSYYHHTAMNVRELHKEPEAARELLGFIVTYKRDVGRIELPNQKTLHIVERQLVGLRSDARSGFDQEIVARMQALAEANPGFSWENIHDERFDALLEESGCKEFIERTVQSDSFEEFVVPVSVTTYGFLEKTKLTAPLAGAAFRRPTIDNGIAYYGPPPLES